MQRLNINTKKFTTSQILNHLFSSNSDAQRVLDRCLQAPLVYNGHILDTVAFDVKQVASQSTLTSHSNATKKVDTIKASGFDAMETEDLIAMFFENRKRSGGGKVASFQFFQEERVAIVQFKSPTGWYWYHPICLHYASF